ncbi:MAG: hypothetical protein QNJ55_10685 [Xenococcus sp. MO_188.B8]|nr:hypothetical protein [Xenococcus sp. MO_188.B8]
MKLQYISTLAAASLLSTSLVGFLPSNASASSVRASAIIVADGHEKECNPCAAEGEEGYCDPCASSKDNPCAGS